MCSVKDVTRLLTKVPSSYFFLYTAQVPFDKSQILKVDACLHSFFKILCNSNAVSKILLESVVILVKKIRFSF